MAPTLRGVVVLLTGVVFGLGLALGNTVWNAFTGRGKAVAAPLDPAIESAALVAEVIDRVRREYVDSVDDQRIVEAAIRGIVAEPEPGTIYTGKVASIVDFGAFVTFMPGKDGLVHVSEIKNERVENVRDVLSEGQEVKVKLVEVDQRGKVRLSMRLVDQETGAEIEDTRPPREPREGGDRGPRGDRGDRGDRHRGGGRDRDRGPRREGGDRGPRREGGDRDRGPRSDRGDRGPRREGGGDGPAPEFAPAFLTNKDDD